MAVVGPTADDPLALLSGYSFPVHLIISDMVEETSQVTTPRAALAPGAGRAQCPLCERVPHHRKTDGGCAGLPGRQRRQTDAAVAGFAWINALIPEAVNAAQESDVVVACVGDLAGLFQSGTVGEGSDTDSLSLPGVQQQLLEALVATGKPVIVVMTGGRPYNLQGLEDKRVSPPG